MKILFLDIDGVLNSHNFFVAEVAAKRESEYAIRHRMDLQCIERLNEVCRRTACKVVLSSTWRKPIAMGLGNTFRIMRHFGFRYRLDDMTPLLGESRGSEISTWLSLYAPDDYTFAVVDDCERDQMAGVLHRFVQTNQQVGLQDADVERLITLLGEEEC